MTKHSTLQDSCQNMSTPKHGSNLGSPGARQQTYLEKTSLLRVQIPRFFEVQKRHVFLHHLCILSPVVADSSWSPQRTLSTFPHCESSFRVCRLRCAGKTQVSRMQNCHKTVVGPTFFTSRPYLAEWSGVIESKHVPSNVMQAFIRLQCNHSYCFKDGSN